MYRSWMGLSVLCFTGCCIPQTVKVQVDVTAKVSCDEKLLATSKVSVCRRIELPASAKISLIRTE